MIYITAVRSTTPSRITDVKWLNGDNGRTGQSSTGAMIEWLNKPNTRAQVGGEDAPSWVGVVNADPPYLRTFADKEWNDNLLALPRF